jgi:small-conductance mechanosensitive channel
MAGSTMRVLLVALLLVLTTLGAAAQVSAPASSAPEQPSPDKVEALTQLLADPAVQAWLREAAAQAKTPADAGRETAPPRGLASLEAGMIAGTFSTLESHLRSLAAGVPRLPGELRDAGQRLQADIADVGILGTLLLLAGFVALGFGADWLFWQSTRSIRQRIANAPIDTLGQRLKITGGRFLFGLCWVAAFAIGTLGACLLFPWWPPLLRTLLLGVLAVVVSVRFALTFTRLLLSPGNEKLRIIPTTTEAAHYWSHRLTIFTGYTVLVIVTLDLFKLLGFSGTSLRLLGYPFGLISVVLICEAIWHQPARTAGGAPPSRSFRIALMVYVALTWLVGRVLYLPPLFNLMAVLVLLPLAIRISHRAVLHMLRPGDLDGDGKLGDEEVVHVPPSAWTVVIERGLRVVYFALGAWIVMASFGVDMTMMTGSDALVARLLRNALRAIAILLVADLLWQLAKTAIDRKLADAANGSATDHADLIRRRQRIRTLLPIARTMLMIVLGTMALLMALSALGIEVGPLIAGAGVVGVAIGFGSQTLVKDVISGMFYLLDDAFRIGEYIVAGSYKGTVESFSIRSVKLRHQRGPLYTVPFGSLGAIQNMSRDWVIDKLAVNVTYDTDLDKVKQIVKKIGKELAADPEFGPDIIEPLKMQGVGSFGDFAMQVQLKMMTLPGKQFTIRRRAYAMLKKAFAEQGIQIAVPTVRVAAGDGAEHEAAAAKAATDMMMAKPVEA